MINNFKWPEVVFGLNQERISARSTYALLAEPKGTIEPPKGTVPFGIGLAHWYVHLYDDPIFPQPQRFGSSRLPTPLTKTQRWFR